MRIEKRIGAALTASALAFGLLATPLESVPLSLGAAVSAQEQEQVVSEYISVDTSSLPDSRELEEAYINSLFYGGGFSFYKDYGEKYLTGASKEIYTLLKSKIQAVASGDEDNTSFQISMTQSFYEQAAMQSGLQAAVKALMADLPASFYWYDKTVGNSYSYSSSSTGEYKIKKVTFEVSKDYRLLGGKTETINYSDGTSKTFNIQTDAAKITSAQDAAKKAQDIAAQYDGLTDYEKIMGYCKEICKLTEYNDNAAGGSEAYGDPWQLVYVFDGDPSTTVVCEGYSKAFQYLCDIGGVNCYTVSGWATKGDPNSRHMWNIVVMDDDKSYLVDVTWSDKGSTADEKWILKGATSSSGTEFTINGNVREYYPETIAFYPEDILTISTTDYVPPAPTPVLNMPETVSADWDNVEDIVCTSKNVPSKDTLTVISSDEAVAEVSIDAFNAENGEITLKVDGKGAGKTTITLTCTAEDGTKVSKECQVTLHKWKTEWSKDDTNHWYDCEDETCTEKKSSAKHDMKEDADSAKEATCTEDGKEADMECSVCGYTEEGETIEKTGHTPGDPTQENIENATCTTAGSYDEVVRCKVCDEIISSVHKDGEMLDHEMEEVEGTAKEPTCGEAGKEANKKCKNCDHTEEGKEIPATGEHTMAEVSGTAKEPTCVEAGKKADTKCSVCGHEEPGEEIPATGVHTPGEPKRINEVAATCTEEGSYDEVIECTVCRKELSKEHKTIEKIPHTPGTPEKENEVPATCTKDGSYDMVTRCTVCGNVTDTEHTVVPALGHIFGDMVRGETTHYQECLFCGTKVGEAAHTKDSGTVTTAPTEGAPGVRTYSCTVCGKVLDTEVIPALEEGHEHSYTIKNSDASSHWNECVCGEKDPASIAAHTPDTKEEIALEAVCNVDGLKYVVTYCTDCDREISRIPTVIPKTNEHNAGADYENDSDYHWNTCTVCGTVMNKAPHEAGPAATETTPQTCTVCGYEIAPVLAHTHTFASAWTSDDNFHWHAATCQHTGEVSGMAVHVWDGGVVTTQPTDTSAGVKTFTCTVCAATKTEPVSALAHTHTPSGAWRFDITGHWHVCGSCNEKLDFAGHSEVSEVTAAPTATVTGTRRYYCSVCGYVIREEVIPATGSVGDPNVQPSVSSGTPSLTLPSATPDEPVLDNGSGKRGWKSIADDIKNASSGDSVYVNMNGTTTLSKTALKELMGKNVDLVLEMGEITWTVNGETVTKASDVNMKAKLNTNNIPNKIIEALYENGDVVQVSLSHSGNFGFDAVMTVYLGTMYNGKYANLMYYNPKSGEAEFIDCSLIIDGKAALDFTHASEYAIVISDEPMGAYEDVSAAAEASESGVSVSPAVYVSVLAVIAAAMVIFRKKAAK